MKVFQSIHRKFFPQRLDLEDIHDWRGHVLSIILSVGVVLGSIAAVPSILLALGEGLWSVAIIDFIVMAWVLTIWGNRSWSFRARAWNFCALLYLLGASFLFTVGPLSQIYLMAFPVIAALLLGLRPALLALVLNAVTLLGVGYLANANLTLLGLEGHSLLKWIVITINFSIINSMITIASAVLLHGLETSLERKRASEERHRLLFESSRDALMTLAPPSWQYTSANQATLEMFRAASALAFTEHHPLDLSPERQPDGRLSEEKAREAIVTAVREGEFAFEWEHQRLDGSLFPANVLLTRMNLGGEVFLQATVRDVTERKRVEEALTRESHRNKVFLRNASDGVHILDADGNVLEASDSFCEMLGYSHEELIGANVSLWDTQWSPQELKQNVAEQLTKENRSIFETRQRRRDGSLVDVEVTGRGLELNGKRVLFNSARDITERKLAEMRIKRLNRVYAMLSGINTLILRVRDRDELFKEACRMAVEKGGFRMTLIAIVDRSVMKIVPVASAGVDEALLTAIKDLLLSSKSASNTMAARAIREKKAVVSNSLQSDPMVFLSKKHAESGVRSLAEIPLIVADEAIGVLALYSEEAGFFDEAELRLLTELAGDIAFAIDHIEKAERLNYLAYYDVLTGLANRSLFLDRVAQYMRSAVSGGHKLAVFLIDLERFKNINDSLGRPAGDALLRQVAEWLTHHVGDANLLARVDADHFATVMPDVKQDGDVVRALKKSMEAFLEHPFRLNDAVFRIAIKVGVALFPNDGASADTLFRNAEAALKKAKASGDRYLFYTQKMTETVAGRLTLENQLRQALDNGEFVLHYQPKVNLVSGKLAGAEALIRWNDPRTGLVPPGRFIPILEETGLINEVGRWALRRAIEDYLRWRAAGLAAVRIAVNVSPLQLRDRGFIAEIEQAIGIDAHAAAGLELEITESLIMEDVKRNIASLQAIQGMGISIAIDDFGTGFSSLSYLAKLPVDALKIDRSFVIEMTTSSEGLALVSTIISLAHSLKLKVVAEGVETEEQSRLLRLLSCDEMQGFLFSKPVPGEIFETRFLAPPPAG